MDGGVRHGGVRAALASAVLFGASTPLAKLILGQGVSPWLLAGLLYVGSGLGLLTYRVVRRLPPVRLPREHRIALIAAVTLGGLVGPALLMLGLSAMPASGASLLLNLEGVLTATLAWVVFRENVDRRVALGMAAIVAGAVVVSSSSGLQLGAAWPSLAVVGACLAWAVDNNLTRTVAVADATWLAAVKGAVAGPVNLALALGLGASMPGLAPTAAALLVGLLGYGVSLTLFVVGLRELGTARAGAYFAVAPFIGAILAVALGEPATASLIVAGLLMALGIWLHLTERHAHEHTHTPLTHEHWHTHGRAPRPRRRRPAAAPRRTPSPAHPRGAHPRPRPLPGRPPPARALRWSPTAETGSDPMRRSGLGELTQHRQAPPATGTTAPQMRSRSRHREQTPRDERCRRASSG